MSVAAALGIGAARAGSLELRGLRKTFGKVVAVEELSLTVAAGEFLTLLGPSGSGKTTTLMMVAGFEAPDGGRILLDGRDITDAPTHRRAIGVAFQHYALFPHMTVFDNVAFALKMRDVPRREIARRAGAALELVRLAGFEERYPRQLSGGQQQRVALARALVFEPALLLLDEPLGALDRLLRERMQLELRRMHGHLGTTMIYVTHDQEEALVLSDRVAVMNEGRIEQIGPPQEIYERPRTRFVAEFIGESNFLRGEVTAVEDGIATCRVGRHGVQAAVAPGIGPGRQVELAIRPEKIAVTRPEAGAAGVSGVVEDRIFVGQTLKLIVRVEAVGHLVVRRQTGSGSAWPRTGDPVDLRWAADDMRVFPAAGPSD